VQFIPTKEPRATQAVMRANAEAMHANAEAVQAG